MITVAITYGVSTTPRFQEFYAMDPSLWHFYYPEAATATPIWLLMVLAFVAPLAAMAAVEAAAIQDKVLRRIWDYFAAVTALTCATAIQLILVVTLKNLVGKPRPDAIHRCLPSSFTAPIGQLSTVEICTSPYRTLVAEGFRSFPSGHASTIFASATVQALFTMGRVRLFDGRGIFLKLVQTGYPFLIATSVSAARVTDNRHFLWDVIAGTFLGIAAGVIAFLLYFPPPYPYIKNHGKAYLPRRFCASKYQRNFDGFWHFEDMFPETTATATELQDRSSANFVVPNPTLKTMAVSRGGSFATVGEPSNATRSRSAFSPQASNHGGSTSSATAPLQ
ncbi:unnamed protein product [Kuraishia capsulata CBS 1993]|uniref:Phosphatidic acid phosphatase type 2/haloperoxidase domain-containing protein n=1 Tax=Kuraishia capsulata CBS 1993 TaxID=1382522 RepID=W6MI29_9ASCO|nr:uncharacterized protein KUCA_T00002015001 [Kuraishia capsulata CBS 1993]CDK26044.1 unnamed protein product [Kuraishia capsulata CBS 1993]